MLNKKKQKRLLLEQNVERQTIKIAVLCGSSPGEIPDLLEIYLLEAGFLPELFIGGYDRYYEDALYGNELAEFAPDVVYVHTTHVNISAFNNLSSELDRWQSIWDALGRLNCIIIQNNFDLPSYRALGSFESSDERGAVRFVNELNHAFRARESGSLYIHDIAFVSAKLGLDVFYNPVYMHLYKYAVSVEAMPAMARSVASMILSLYGRRKKCLVLDLDNTLWGGVVGDTGADGLEIGPVSAKGEEFLEFQRLVKRLAGAGVVLCVASKNEYATAQSGFAAEGMLLTLDDFALFYANWEPKSENILRMADTLNLGLDSFVFVDDNPAERELVRGALPEVTVIEADTPSGFIAELTQLGLFDTVRLSDEDVQRGNQYRQNAARQSATAAFRDYRDYLLSLEMRCEFSAVSAKNLARVTQLVGKTNQFNLTTLRLNEAQISERATDPSRITICARLIDKFGDNGLVSVLIGHCDDGICDIELWLMSCRVFKRDLELAVFDELVRQCHINGISTIRGVYKPTAKNKPVENLYAELGFTLKETKNGETSWLSDISEYKNKADVFSIEHVREE